MINTPVVLFVFKRKDTVVQIMKRLSVVKPKKLYILSDEGRNKEERKLVKEVRGVIDVLVDWNCEVVKNYAFENRGVHENIGLGAKWVFEREETAIFLEDDNIPEYTFFEFCETLLQKYKNEDRVLWICGTNYLESYTNENNDSYMFTQNLLPCGWASWSDKFLKYYDAQLDTILIEEDIKKIKKNYRNKKLYKQQFYSIGNEFHRKEKGIPFRSWDYQMAYSLRYYGLLGISPSKNQIKNIGVDQMAEHGGSSMDMIMTQRFCEIETRKLEFPLHHPNVIEVDEVYEKKIDEIILFPLKLRIKSLLNRWIKRIIGMNIYEPIRKKHT